MICPHFSQANDEKKSRFNDFGIKDTNPVESKNRICHGSDKRNRSIKNYFEANRNRDCYELESWLLFKSTGVHVNAGLSLSNRMRKATKRRKVRL